MGLEELVVLQARNTNAANEPRWTSRLAQTGNMLLHLHSCMHALLARHTGELIYVDDKGMELPWPEFGTIEEISRVRH